MSHMSYNRFNGRKSCNHGSRGFKLNSKRFSVQGLRARFVYLFKLLSRWRFSYGQALKSLKKGINRSNYSIKRNNSTSSRRSLMMESAHDRRMRSFGRSNSFYAEAIADCLEFIKRSSISVDQKPVCCQR